MSRIVTVTDDKSSNLVSYDSSYQAYSVEDLNNALTSISSTTYASIYLTRGASAETYIYYNFAFNIPLSATINSVTAKVKAYISTTGYVTEREIQLYSGTTQKGTAINPTTSTTTFTFSDTGTWTAQELNNARIRAYVKRGVSRPDNSYVLRLYGATITVNYTYNKTVYEVTASSDRQAITVSPLSVDVDEGDDTTITILGSLFNTTVKDNGTDVTSQLVPITLPSVGAEYTLYNVQNDHVIVVNSEDKIFVKVNSTWVDAQKVYIKDNGSWQSVADAYKKSSSSWVKQEDKSAIFDQDALFVYNNFRVDENVSAHVNVTCFDGGDGSVTVVASGGTPPYQYSLDPTFSAYNTDGMFSNLSLVAPVDEGTDQYGGILISHRRFYVRDAEGLITSCVVDLKSPVELEWLNCPDDIIVFCDPAQNYATIVPNVDFIAPSLSTLANFTDIEIANLSPDNHYPIGTRSIAYYTEDACKSYDGVECTFLIKVLPLYFPNAVQDYDGNWYDAVVIGNQVWLAQNLRTTHYADGTAIPAGGSTTSDTDPYYYDYSSSDIPLKDRGLLYNWPAVMNGAASSNLNPSEVQGIAPNGWHVPSDAEWTQLTNYVGSVPEYILDNNSSYIAKALASQNYWNTSTNAYAVGNDLTANNKTLFGVVPAGLFSGGFSRANIDAIFFSSEEPPCLRITYTLPSIGTAPFSKSGGASVRCICDLSPMDFAAWYYQQYGSYNHQLPTE